MLPPAGVVTCGGGCDAERAHLVFALLLVHGGSYLVGIVFAAIFVGVLLPAVWSGNPTRRTAATSIIRLLLSNP